MPCYDARDYDSRVVNVEVENFHDGKMAAMLCSALTYIHKTASMEEYIGTTDWKEVGLPQTAVISWWNDHVAHDYKRRQAERQAKKKAEELAQLKVSALAKLSTRERAALGF